MSIISWLLGSKNVIHVHHSSSTRKFYWTGEVSGKTVLEGSIRGFDSRQGAIKAARSLLKGYWEIHSFTHERAAHKTGR